MNIVLISSLRRPNLLRQSLDSLRDNASNWSEHTLTLVIDGSGPAHLGIQDTLIINSSPQGASASRNIGASSIPSYRRQSHVCFFDDDIYACPGWDEKLMELSDALPHRIASGHGHPFNGSELIDVKRIRFQEPLVISTVNMLMPWGVWDDVGPFDEPGGPGGSEDYALCMRAKEKGYGFAVTDPQCILHTGITSSSGKPIVGQEHVVENNRKLMELYGLKGVVFE